MSAPVQHPASNSEARKLAESGLGLRDVLLSSLMAEYGGEPEDWTAMRSLTRVLVDIRAHVTAGGAL